jgi:hypothetical protein
MCQLFQACRLCFNMIGIRFSQYIPDQARGRPRCKICAFRGQGLRNPLDWPSTGTHNFNNHDDVLQRDACHKLNA